MTHASSRAIALAPVALLASAAAALACGGPQGALEGTLTRADLTGEERVLVEERFASDFAEAARLGIAADALFGFERCELNAAEPPELIAIGRSPAHCLGVDQADRPICGVWALAVTPEGWVEVLEGAGTARLASSTTNGWRDLVLERGDAPAVVKFGGVAYQEDLGDADPLADPLDDWDAVPGDGGGIDWYAFDDPMPPEAEAAFLWFYRRQAASLGERVGVLPDAFRVGVAELDGAPPAEALIQALSPQDCSPQGCRHWVLSSAGGERSVTARFEGFDVEVALTGGVGGADLVVFGGAGVEIWRNDGAGWTARDPGP
ncbi:MAG: hypothetical protein AAF192_02205 [Pseudomonadota bacterium]